MDTKKLFSLFFAFAVFLSLFAPVAVRADIDSGVTEKGILSLTCETPANFSQYTNPDGKAKLLYDDGYIVLKYKDASVYPKVIRSVDSIPGRVWFSSYVYNTFFIQSWISVDGVEFVDLIYFYDNGSYRGYSTETDQLTGKGGFRYSQCYWMQFRYSDAGLVQTACEPRASYDTLIIDSYVFDTECFILYAENPLGCVSIGSKTYYNDTPSPYDFTYKTTFRMLTDGATVYNTYHYDNCYKGGDDIIKCLANANTTNESGRYVVVEAVKLTDGAKSVTKSPNPTMMCQISSYGMAYDIVYTNDDNLLSLLGIEKPPESYWDVEAQQWKAVNPGGMTWDDVFKPIDFSKYPTTDVINPDGSSPFENSGSVPGVSWFTVSSCGTASWIKYSEYSKFFGDSLMHVSTSPSTASDAWGLGSTLKWSVGDSGGRDIKVQVAATVSVQLADGTKKQHSVILQDYDGRHPGNNKAFQISASGGTAKVALYDLIAALQEQIPAYNQNPPARLLGVAYFLTPYYYEDGTYYRGTFATATHLIDKDFAAMPAPTLTPTPDSGWDFSSDGFDAIVGFLKNIGAMLVGIPSFLVDLLGTFGELISKVGEVPLLLGTLFTFLPSELLTVIRLGVLACVVIGVIRWIRG